jgi:LysM repeat protein
MGYLFSLPEAGHSSGIPEREGAAAVITDENSEETAQVCPHLRLAEDPWTWSPEPDAQNRCYRPAPVREDHQAEWCLANAHVGCPGPSPVAIGLHHTGTRLMLGRQRMTRRDAEEFVRTVLAIVAVMGLLLVVFSGVLISGSAKPDVVATRIASPGAGEAGNPSLTLPHAQDPVTEDATASTETVAGREDKPTLTGAADEDEAQAPILGMPATTLEAAPPSSPYLGAVAPLISAPRKPEPEPAPAIGGTVYEVKRGDTVYSLARAHGVTVDAIMEANRMDDPNSIKAGQPLTIPEPTRAP